MMRALGLQFKLVVLNLDFDSALLRVGSNMESLYRLFELETMGDERLEINEAAGNQTNGLGVLLRASITQIWWQRFEAHLVSIAILEFDVDFVGA